MVNLSLTKETKTYNEEKTVSQVTNAGNIWQPHIKNEIRTFSNTIHKNNSKWVIDLDTIKLQERNTDRMLFDINCSGYIYTYILYIYTYIYI